MERKTQRWDAIAPAIAIHDVHSRKVKIFENQNKQTHESFTQNEKRRA